MAVRVVRLGSPRANGEGLRIGTVRRPPRGVRKEKIAEQDYYDAWLPDLAPTQALLSWALAEPLTPSRWHTFERKYRSEMKEPAPARLLQLLAALSQTADFSVGCYCEEESRCHRSILRQLLREAGAALAG